MSETEGAKGRQTLGEDGRPSIVTLVDTIIEMSTFPADAWAVAALLESTGLRDLDAVNKFERENIFVLAQEVFDSARERELKANRLQPFETMSIKASAIAFAQFFFRGLFFSAPMVGQIVSILVLRFSLWAYLGFSELEASLVGFGTVGSFLATGMFVMALGRQGSFYKGQENFVLLYKNIVQLLRFGFVLVGVSGVLLIVSPVLYPLLSPRWASLAGGYYVLLGVLWLFFAVLYFLEDHIVTFLSTALGVLVVWFFFDVCELPIYIAHFFGIAGAMVMAAVWVVFRLRKKRLTSHKKHKNSVLPPVAVQYVILKRYLAYGTLYFTFLFLDRLVVWTALSTDKPFVVWFHTPYELGMDWALLSLVVTIASLDYSVHQFSRQMVPRQEACRGEEPEVYRRHFSRFAITQVLIIVVVGALSVVGTYFAIDALRALNHIPEVADFFESDITPWVFWFAAVSYWILSMTLMVALFHFTLGCASGVVKALAGGIVINLVSGWLLSRLVSPEFGVIGLLCGCIAFAAFLAPRAVRFFRALDYNYYAAY